MFRNLSTLVIIAVLLLVSVDAFARCMNINGNSSGVILAGNPCGSILPSGGCLSGTARGGLEGDFDVVIDGAVPHPTFGVVFFFSGQTTLVSKMGDTLIGIDAIATNLFTGESADLLTWVFGTGEFAGASGQVVLETTLDFINSTFESRISGELCTP